ncbi:PAAR-like domain-containing protein [Hyalangium versicolor]|uniref:PAAR-like domain-containing protein n=1 Tax=Hyalangium versicolor TaxID=2861190 RepID=UPI001CCDF56C|nr:PAAR-like domain-containing protein [Hyalangium versicolor]
MSLTTTKMEAATCKQPLKFVPLAPNVCLIPAPPPPAGPQGIPTPFPITTDTSKIDKKPVPKVKHKGGEVPNTDSVFSGIQGNVGGVGQLPPSKPTKDILTGVNLKNASAIVGCPNCQVGGKSFIMTGSPGLGNHT